jgi:Putative p-aminobenzoyl-glutamate transporter
MPTANYYFMAVSTIVIAVTGTWVTKRFVEPRLGHYSGDVPKEEITDLTSREKSGLRWAGITLALFMGVVVWGLVPDHGFLRGADNQVLHSPVLKGFISFCLSLPLPVVSCMAMWPALFKKARGCDSRNESQL